MKALAAFGAGLFLAGASLVVFDYTQQDTSEKTLKQTQQQVTELKKENAKLQAFIKTEEKASTSPSTDAKKDPTKNNPPASNEDNASKNNHTYKLHVEVGMGSSEISKTLEKAGIISDAKDFESFITKQNMSNKMQIGTFILNQDSSYEELLRILTTPPKK